PRDEQPRLGPDGEAEPREVGLAAGLDFVEIEHRGPGSLPAAQPLALPVGALRPEDIDVVAILLAGAVALALPRLGLGPVEPGQRVHPSAQLERERFAAEIVGRAGAD